jgi:hypothetical protein
MTIYNDFVIALVPCFAPMTCWSREEYLVN